MSIDINNLRKKYSSLEVLKGISCRFQDHEKYLIIGENGIGKSTFLKSILNIVKYEGEIIVEGRISYAPDGASMPPYMNVYSFIKMFSTLTEDINDYDLKLDKYFELLNAENRLKKCYLGSLSKGQKQKINLIQAFITPSEILFLDEPTSGLDLNSKEKLIKMIEDENRMVLVISHEKELFSKDKFNIIEFKNGKIEVISKVHKNPSILPIK